MRMRRQIFGGGNAILPLRQSTQSVQQFQQKPQQKAQKQAHNHDLSHLSGVHGDMMRERTHKSQYYQTPSPFSALGRASVRRSAINLCSAQPHWPRQTMFGVVRHEESE